MFQRMLQEEVFFTYSSGVSGTAKEMIPEQVNQVWLTIAIHMIFAWLSQKIAEWQYMKWREKMFKHTRKIKRKKKAQC